MNDADIDLVMFVENIFDTHIPLQDAERGLLGMQESLEHSLSNRRPTIYAADLLRSLAKTRRRPGLSESLQKPWRPEQIRALLLDIFRKRNSPVELHEMLLIPRLRRAERRYLNQSIWQKLAPTDASIAIVIVLLTVILLFRSLL